MWELLTGEEPYADMHCGAIIGKNLSTIVYALNEVPPPFVVCFAFH